jgi:heme-degrading monooxygenase HmoA
MVVVLFRSRLTDAAGDDYGAMAREMEERARAMAGFKSYRAADGEHLSVIWWENEDTLAAWRDDFRHIAAQRLGREKWYTYFKLEVAEITRAYDFTRKT